MTFRDDVTKSAPGASKRGPGGTVAIGGGLGTLVLVALFIFMGGDPKQLESMLGQQTQQEQSSNGQEQASGLDHCKVGADANKYDDCRVDFTASSLNVIWGKVLPEQAQIEYTRPDAVIFQGSTNSGCGQASASTGPFYCPRDQSAYFDVSFFEQLRGLGAKNAPFAQEYIIAHEFGHHIQQLEGTLKLSNYNQPGADSNAVKIELQADCYAGVWAHHADDGENALLKEISQQEVQDAIAAAQAVGDDNIQKRSGGEVRPEAWTHGSSAQRAEAFMAGFNTGKMSSCDTLERGVYR
ncbi:KPN_02809 family neutral zinc metallopeptidase [Corynebacterium freiburgense]|uniref:KPN_02809 family neutral zinc metallopeptidase n=1 Tax=Corynebacterium freiburgense TaxID=556548 RepID=UPI000420D4EF|nr:neutral zinc metallopeptidase [Corynebacterium freiburgense]WJZ02806.1 Putative neutral zinc metallopeptidase [Corynebacterium freiburgense]